MEEYLKSTWVKKIWGHAQVQAVIYGQTYVVRSARNRRRLVCTSNRTACLENSVNRDGATDKHKVFYKLRNACSVDSGVMNKRRKQKEIHGWQVSTSVTTVNINRKRQPPYLPDLAPTDFFLFPCVIGVP